MSILIWLVSLAVHADRHGFPIPRPYGAATTIAQVVASEPEDLQRIYAATLDVLAAHESAYRTGVTGDGGKSCGAYQTPCARTPADGLGQTRLALSILKDANDRCPGHPIWLYASGHCASSRTALWYEAEVRSALQAN
jgi:hypothetical protein